MSALEHRAHHGDAEPTGHVVVARARLAQRVRKRVLSQGSDRRLRRKPSDGLEQLADRRSGQPVIPVATMSFDAEQAGAGQLA